jgi:hypothetical protein
MNRASGFALSLMLAALAGCAATAAPPPPAEPQPPPPPGIQVVAGSYGVNCKALHGNKTDHLRQTCGGQMTCSYKVDHTVIGDPVGGCEKDYVAEWRCGADPTVRKATAPGEAGWGSIVELRCE